MPAFELTLEQKEIVKFVRDETRNLAVIARAGTGKTSTIVQMAGAMREPSAPVPSLQQGHRRRDGGSTPGQLPVVYAEQPRPQSLGRPGQGETPTG